MLQSELLSSLSPVDLIYVLNNIGLTADDKVPETIVFVKANDDYSRKALRIQTGCQNY